MILIGVGGNLPTLAHGGRRRTLTAALAALGGDGIAVAARSAWYRSEPVPRSDQPWYVNAVARLATTRRPGDLLAVLQCVERRFGRVRGARNAARAVDLDLLDYDGLEIDTLALVLPHPRLHQRRFVLLPLAELVPDWRHPRLGRTAAELVAALATREIVYPVPPEPDDPVSG
jgi:2-amino-4-hydroxy-6-hydroxymethyldihydropteridine diphosphokinase